MRIFPIPIAFLLLITGLLLISKSISKDVIAPDAKQINSASLDLSKYLRNNGTTLKLPPEVTDADLLQLRQAAYSNVRELLLVGASISNKGLQSITHLPLSKLYLTDTAIDDRGLEVVARLKLLSQLSLNNTGITDNGLASLTALPLKKLYLNDTEVSDRGTVHLKQLPLETLYMRNTHLGDSGMAVLRELRIRALNISGTLVSDASMPILRAFPLKKVYLRDSAISWNEAESLKLANVRIDL